MTVRLIEPLERPPDATVRLPGSKSLTNRALVLASLADAPSVLRGALRADDTDAMISALRALGTGIDVDGTEMRVTPGDVVGPDARIHARLSGTTSRFILPVAALAGVPVVVDGSEPLRRRPMGPVLDALAALGVDIEVLGEPGFLPVRVSGEGVRGGPVSVAAAGSSQFLSALLLIGPCLADGLVVDAGPDIAARPFVDLTIETLEDFGAEVTETEPGRFVIAPATLRGRAYDIEPDATAASYLAAAAAITGGRVRLDGLGPATRQGDMAFFAVLERMGATVERLADATVVTGGPLRGIDIDLSANPDTAQTLAAVAVFASSPTRVRGVEIIRHHETDRIAAVVAELRRLGIEATETDDGFTIVPGRLHPATVQTYDDHRMAMSFALLGLVAPGIGIADSEVVSKTYPGYFTDLASLGTP